MKLKGANDDAVSQVFSFLVGGVVLMASVGAVMVATTGIDSSGPSGHVGIKSSTLASMLVDSAGVGWDAGNGTVLRLGLAHEGGGSLDVGSLGALRGASVAADADNHVIDYDEAKESLAMHGWEFRVTIAPIGLADELAAMDLGGIRTAYVGSWIGAPSVLVPDDATRILSAHAALDAAASTTAATERQALVGLALGFDDEVDMDSLTLDVHVDSSPPKHITETSPATELQGDVFPDQKQYLADVLPSRLAQYDLLVVGSDVQHNALSSDALKSAVRDWVMAGGTLMVLGSDSQSTQWLQPLFHVGTTNVNGGAYAPHVTHPMLREPHALSWDDYATPSSAWDIRDQGAQAHEDDFDHVVMASDGDLLAVSRPGAFGQGMVLLTSYQPGEMEQGPEEGQSFMHNLIVFTDRSHLYLEYGAVPGPGAEIGSALRHSLLHDVEMGPVAVRIQVLVWRGN